MTDPGRVEGAETANAAYAQHLAAVNEKQAVRASNDVYSVHGVLIARRGAAIDYETARKIVRHKLTMPLDRSVELESLLSAPNLFRRFDALFQKFSDVRHAHVHLGFQAELERHATRLELPRLIAQKLTVMAHRVPALLDQTLLGSWMACLIGRELGLEEKEIALLYLAAVSRDVGMLHIEPRLLDLPSTHLYGPDEWKTLQSHVVASHMILKECEGVPERVLDAVIQHHENHDGTGYPSNLAGEELGLMGQVLSLADTVAALRLRRFAGSGRNLRDAQAIVQIDADAYRPEVTSAAVRVLVRCGVERTSFHPYVTRQELVDNVRRRARAMVTCANILADMPNLIPVEKKKLTPIVLTALITRMVNVLARSGLADGEVPKWLGLLADGKEEADLADLAELDLQQRELLWQFRRLMMNLHGFAEKEKMRSRSPVRMMVERMRAFFEQLESGRTVEPAEGATELAAAGEAQALTIAESDAAKA